MRNAHETLKMSEFNRVAGVPFTVFNALASCL